MTHQLTASDVGFKSRWHGNVNSLSGDRAIAVTSGSRIDRQRFFTLKDHYERSYGGRTSSHTDDCLGTKS